MVTDSEQPTLAVQTSRYRPPLARRMGSILTYAVLIFFFLLATVPFLLVFLTAVKDSTEIATNPLGLPQVWRFENFVTAWVQARFGLYFRSSILVTVAVVFLSTIFSTLSGYAFGRMRFPFSNALFFLFIIGLMVPTESYIIPLYYNLRSIGMTDTYWALILPQVGMSVCFGSFWMRGFFAGVPGDLVDAARVDGANNLQALWNVILPVVMPGVMTMLVLFFIWTWNDFFLALVMVTKEELRTLPLGLAFFQGKYTSNYALTAAGASIVALPTILFFALFQRQFIRGVTVGAIKG